MSRQNYKKRGNGGGGGGRGRGNKGRGRGGGRGGGGQRNFQDNRVSFEQVYKHNEKFEQFYNTINIVPEGPEREEFWAALRRELPNSFRFTGSKGHALGVRDIFLNRYFPLIEKIQHEGRPVTLPTPIAWYPEGLAYSMTTPKNVVRKYGPFKDFQKFLVSETGVGNISRQEEVSMIPPMLLDVQPHHTVLDLCAAPGSKSAQLVELIHAGEEERVNRALKLAKSGSSSTASNADGDIGQDYGRATGLLIANDVDYRRAQMLVHQVKRLNSPNLIVTNHDATLFPSIKLPKTSSSTGSTYLKFDRILADVPCTGDGTCRKNPNIWKDWTPQNGLGLYSIQVRILTRALQMLKVGGRVVYSTCSLNPVENEAVVASAIERCGGVGKVKLVDCSDQLPKLKRNPGLKDWSIMARSGQVYESWAEASQYENEDSKIMPGMFPPEPEEQIPIENCMRVYPHQQDTGGFFITVLEKLGDIRAKPINESKSGNKQWSLTPSATQPATVNELSEELEPTVNENGSAPPANGTSGTKRPAPSDEDDQDVAASAKKPKIEDVPVIEESTAQQKVAAPAPLLNIKPKKGDAATDESFKYLSPSHPELESIYAYYGLHESFPRDRFLVRNPAGDPVKGIYYSSQLVKDIFINNENIGMKFVHGGVKMFMKQDAQKQDICRWRIQTEGLPIIDGWVGDQRVVKLNKKSTLRTLLVEMFPKISPHRDSEGKEVGGWLDLGEIGPVMRDIGMGCCVVHVEASPDPGDDDFKEPFTVPLWRSLHSMNLMLPKEDRRAMLLRIFNEDVELVNHADRNQNGGAAADSSLAEGQTGEVGADGDAVAEEVQAEIENEAADDMGDPAEVDEPMLQADAVEQAPTEELPTTA